MLTTCCNIKELRIFLTEFTSNFRFSQTILILCALVNALHFKMDEDCVLHEVEIGKYGVI